MKLTKDQSVAIRHILSNGDDANLKSKKWSSVKIELCRLGLLTRRIGDWAWIPTEFAKSSSFNN